VRFLPAAASEFMAPSQPVEFTKTQKLSTTNWMVSKAKLGMSQTPKIPDKKQHQQPAKSVKTGSYQSRIIGDASAKCFDLSISMYSFGDFADASRRCRGRLASEWTESLADNTSRTTTGTRFFQRPLVVGFARGCGRDIFEEHRLATCHLKSKHDRRGYFTKSALFLGHGRKYAV
jgi:ribosomal protein S30